MKGPEDLNSILVEEENRDLGDMSFSHNSERFMLPDGSIIDGSIKVNRKNEGDPYTVYIEYTDVDGSQKNIQVAFIGTDTILAEKVYREVTKDMNGVGKFKIPTEAQVKAIIEKFS